MIGLDFGFGEFGQEGLANDSGSGISNFPSNGYTAEDGVTFYTAEDVHVFYVKES